MIIKLSIIQNEVYIGILERGGGSNHIHLITYDVIRITITQHLFWKNSVNYSHIGLNNFLLITLFLFLKYFFYFLYFWQKYRIFDRINAAETLINVNKMIFFYNFRSKLECFFFSNRHSDFEKKKYIYLNHEAAGLMIEIYLFFLW